MNDHPPSTISQYMHLSLPFVTSEGPLLQQCQLAAEIVSATTPSHSDCSVRQIQANNVDQTDHALLQFVAPIDEFYITVTYIPYQ